MPDLATVLAGFVRVGRGLRAGALGLVRVGGLFRLGCGLGCCVCGQQSIAENVRTR